MYCLNLKENKRYKSGHHKMQTPIMLCLKARGIRTTPPGNSCNLNSCLEYLKLTIGGVA